MPLYFIERKYSPQMIHQLTLRFCQVKMKYKLVMKIIYILCRCTEMNIDTLLWLSETTCQRFSTLETIDKLYSLGNYSNTASLIKHLAGLLEYFLCVVLGIKPSATCMLSMYQKEKFHRAAWDCVNSLKLTWCGTLAAYHVSCGCQYTDVQL
jgi:hypothetical protein